jgi:hypothetical protein
MPSDKFSVRAVVIVLAIVAIGSLAAMVGLTIVHQQVPDSIDRAFTLSLGALIGVLAQTRTGGQPAQDVNVVNEPANPVPVEQGDT